MASPWCSSLRVPPKNIWIRWPGGAVTIGTVTAQLLYEIGGARYAGPDVTSRFDTITLKIWQKHGIEQAGFWTVLVGEGGNQDLHYLLAWESLAEREAKWNKFTADPEWLAKRAESERDGPIIASIKNMFLQPTAFSAVK